MIVIVWRPITVGIIGSRVSNKTCQVSHDGFARLEGHSLKTHWQQCVNGITTSVKVTGMTWAYDSLSELFQAYLAAIHV